MYDEASFHRFGTTLPELDEDNIPSKKPIRLEDQIVTDENGKRRFHGAFTGGFSAGYWNTVGSQEGWTPATFKSSRSEKAAQRFQQCPDDFMDDEDRGEFGIAPQRLQTRAEYTTFEPEQSRKRKLMVPSVGPIPGKPVLEQLFVPRHDKVSERILKSMGWRTGQGIGPRQTRSEKKLARARNRREMYLMQQYGYQPNASIPQSPGHSDEADGEIESSDEEMDKLTFAPDDYEPYVCVAKKDRFGLGYRGSLSRDPVLSNSHSATTSNRHINLFEPALEALGKNNKKISFQGQAFGVGALEEEDEDIYAKDDMSRYDFSLEDNKQKKKKTINVQDQLIIDGFAACKIAVQLRKSENPIIPGDFIPRNWMERRSRFQPIDPKRAEELDSFFKKAELSKNRLNPDERAELLGEMRRMDEKPLTSINTQQSQKQLNDLQEAVETRVEGGNDKLPEKARVMMKCLEQEDRFTSASSVKKSDPFTEMLKNVHNRSNKSDSMPGMFRPFMHDEQKQRRYEEFLLAEVKTEEEIACFLNRIQPVHLSDWDREMEKKEFIQAKKIFKPLDGLMSQRFVSESHIQAEHSPSNNLKTNSSAPKQISVERSKSMWKPSSLLCKRYNIAEPYGGLMEEDKRPTASSKISVFDYLEDCVHKKSDFKTPVIVPMKIPEIKPILKQSKCIMKNESVNTDKTNISTCSVSTMTSPMASSSSSAASIVVVDQLKSKHSRSKSLKDNCPKIGRPAAKTDLEKLSEDSISKPPCEKLELYRAIFDDSSDEDGNEQYEVTVISKEGENDCVFKKECSSEASGRDLSVCLSVSIDQMNVLRNTSPPRGIFSALLSTKETQRNNIKQAKECESVDSTEIVIDCDIDDTCDDKKHANSDPCVAKSKLGLIPSTATPIQERRMEFKRPASTSSKTSLNTASTSSISSNSSKDQFQIDKPEKMQPKKETKSPENDKISNRLCAGGYPSSRRTSVSFDLPSTSSGGGVETYGPALPQHIRTTTTVSPTPKKTETKDLKEMNKIVEEKMIRFLVQRAKSSGDVRNEEWVEKKVRKILKTKTLSTSSSSSSSSSDDGDCKSDKRHRSQKKKSKKNKINKKTKKKSKDKKTKKSKKKKDKH